MIMILQLYALQNDVLREMNYENFISRDTSWMMLYTSAGKFSA